jgi:hypothetical protein
MGLIAEKSKGASPDPRGIGLRLNEEGWAIEIFLNWVNLTL